ncbi:hybrid sensor histidine kinase/response regulator [Sporosarcina sp. CAU 1771]
MMSGDNKITRKKIYLIISLFLLILTVFRVSWIFIHQIPEHPHPEKGVVDLREWSFTDDQTITLDGQWEFYPFKFVQPLQTRSSKSEFISIPSDWKNKLQSADPIASYGYGTYRLKVLLPPGNKQIYGLRMKTVTTASALFINGTEIARHNDPVKSATKKVTEEGPYSALFSSESNEVEVLLHVSNYEIPFFGGVTDSIMIGTAAAINKEDSFSSTLQLIVAILSIVYALHAFFIYFFSIDKYRKEVFSLGLLLILSAFANLIDDDVVLQLPLSMEWSNKLLLFIFLSTLLALLQFIKNLFHLKSRTYKYLVGLYGTLLLGMILTPFEKYEFLVLFLFVFYAFSIVFLFYQTIKVVRNNSLDAILILLFISAYTSNVFWGAGIKFGFSNIPYYPFDFLIAIFVITILLIKRHIRIVDENKVQKRELQKADKLKDDFLANTSHELRNPLHGILNIAQVILADDNDTLSTNNKKSLELLSQVARQMSFTLNDLLDSTRLEGNHIRLRKENISIQTTASGVIDMLQFMLESKPINLRMDISPEFPAVEADENRLTQILFNLLHNAVKFTQKGTISIYASHDDKEATIYVKDSGIGIDDAMQQLIFNRYIQKSSSLNSTGGVGIGLVVTKQLVELHEGTISVESQPGEGALFSFTLRLASQEPSSIPMTKSSESSRRIDNELLSSNDSVSIEGKPRILIIDDDFVNLRILRHLLQRTYNVTEASNGKDALVMMDKTVYDLVVCDVMMPNMSGYEFTQLVRKRFSISELPILLLTARSQPEDIVAGFLSGANDYVSKPIDALSLQSRVQALTDLRRSIKEQNRMEAAWLQAQIQPHFLFNTLNSIASLAEFDTTRMTMLLQEFGNYLRHSFATQNTQDLIPLSDELMLIRSYLYIEQERFGERILVEWDTDSLEGRLIPPLAIQTVVENAVRHGLLQQCEGGTVIIQTRNYATYYEIIIQDNGVGMDASKVQIVLQDSPQNGIGLANTNRRLTKLFNKGLQITSHPGKGTTVKFVIPYQ